MAMKPSSVSFIGSGNLAWHLAPALDNVGFAVREVYSPNQSHARALVDRLYEGRVMDEPDFSDSASKIFVIAVTDDAIADVVGKLTLPAEAILVHTSGSQPLSLLESGPTSLTGVFYPLQTFSKAKKVDFADIPIFVESDDASVLKVLVNMAKALSRRVTKISSEDRQALHVAAVFASNFTNHMLSISKAIMQNSKLDFNLLAPLIAETLNKGLSIGPEKSQTGPARRGDLEILDRHMAFLQEDAALAEMYKVISQHIVDTYHES